MGDQRPERRHQSTRTLSQNTTGHRLIFHSCDWQAHCYGCTRAQLKGIARLNPEIGKTTQVDLGPHFRDTVKYENVPGLSEGEAGYDKFSGRDKLLCGGIRR